MRRESTSTRSILYSTFADRLGLTGSILCLIHCMAIPALAMFGTGLAGGMAHQHGVFFEGDDYVFVIMATVAVLMSVKFARSGKIAFALICSMLFFATPLLLAKQWEVWHDWEWLSHLGAVGLAVSHWFNLRLIRRQVACQASSNA